MAAISAFSGWIKRRPVVRFPLLAFLAGALLSTIFAPTNFALAAFIVMPFLVFLIDQTKNPRQAFSVGWWTGFGLLSVGLTWIGHSFSQQDNVPQFLAPFAIFALAAIMSLYYGVAFWLCHRFWRSGPERILLFSAVWVLFELVRGYFFTGFPWHIVGSMWSDWLPAAQLARPLSVYGLSALTVFAAASLAVFLSPRRSALKYGLVVVPIGVMLIGAVWGQARLANNTTSYELGVSMRLVQANINQREKWIPYLIDDHFDRYMRLSRGKSEKGKAEGVKLLIWPETAVQREHFDRDGSLLRWRMSRLLDFGSYAITGAPRYERTPDGVDYFNSLVAFNSRGQLYARYDKQHLVPFAEYLPAEGVLSWLGLSHLTGGSAFTSGDKPQTIRLPGVPPFSPLICYEVIFPGEVTDPSDRPAWLLNITNDGWFGLTNGPYQHLALARMRSIEEGLPLVRSASTGVSAVIDAYGRTVSQLALDRRGILESPLPKAISAPAYSTGLKILAVFLLTVLVLVGFVISSLKPRVSKQTID